MSKIHSKLKGLQELRRAKEYVPVTEEISSKTPELHIIENVETVKEIPVMPKTQKPQELPIVLIATIIIMLGLVFYLGALSSNIVTDKNAAVLKMNADIEEQQKQITLLKKKISAMESSNKELEENMQGKLDDISQNVQSKFNQNAMDTNRMEAVLQANIDTLNTKMKKLQSLLPKNKITVTSDN